MLASNDYHLHPERYHIQVQKARQGLQTLNDIIELVNTSLGFQLIVICVQYFIVGIFSSLDLFEASRGHSLSSHDGVRWFSYFTISNHISLILICLISCSCQTNVSIFRLSKWLLVQFIIWKATQISSLTRKVSNLTVRSERDLKHFEEFSFIGFSWASISIDLSLLKMVRLIESFEQKFRSISPQQFLSAECIYLVTLIQFEDMLRSTK